MLGEMYNLVYFLHLKKELPFLELILFAVFWLLDTKVLLHCRGLPLVMSIYFRQQLQNHSSKPCTHIQGGYFRINELMKLKSGQHFDSK